MDPALFRGGGAGLVVTACFNSEALTGIEDRPFEGDTHSAWTGRHLSHHWLCSLYVL
jgi:hypothetical protein